MEQHPEAVWAANYVRDRTLEVGCGGYPTPGVTWTVDQHPRGMQGVAGNQQGVISQADVGGRMDELPFRDGAFYTLVARHVLEHHGDTLAVLREWRRVARRLVVVCPNQRDYPSSTIALDPTHQVAFTPRQLHYLAEHAGWYTRRIEYPVENWSFGYFAQG